MLYKGGCHCGQIAFEIDVEQEIKQAIECNCSICTKRGHLIWVVPGNNFRLTSLERNMSTYTFNKHVIKHRFCVNCGCGPFGEGTDAEGNAVIAVNVRCIEGLEVKDLRRIPFDGRKL